MASRSSKTEASSALPAEPADARVAVGRILRPHGVRGEVKVEVWSDVDDRFAPGRDLVAQRGGVSRPLRVEGFRPVRGAGIVRFHGVATRDDAEALRDHLLEVSEDDVPEAPDGHYYHFQLIGCRVVDVERGDLGVVVSCLDDGGGTLLAVEPPDDSTRRLLVPFVDELPGDVDVAARRIEVRLPEGLIESCTSRS